MRDMAVVNYHVVSDQPQSFGFDRDGIAGRLESPELIPTAVPVRDLRHEPEHMQFRRDGIAFSHHRTRAIGIGSASNWQAEYDRELAELLLREIGAVEVLIFDHTVRVDDPNATRRPARNVHNDFSQAGAEQRLIDLVGSDRATEFERGHYGFVNVWRPLDHPVKTSPLGFIHPNSASAEDWMTIDLVYPDRNGEILGVAANDDHQWIYMSEMTPEDIVIFNVYDNRGRPFLGHSALDMQDDAEGRHPRKSLESRTLVRYR
ncbi:MAG: CmcJ/NvfI family oxidoreductase [Pseudomonadota bacterium]